MGKLKMSSSIKGQKQILKYISASLQFRWCILWQIQLSSISHELDDTLILFARVGIIPKGAQLPKNNAIRPDIRFGGTGPVRQRLR